MVDDYIDIYFNTHPVLPVTLIVMNIIAFISLYFLFSVITRTPLHHNCKYLLTAWAFGFFLMFSTHVAISLANLTDPHGYLAHSRYIPPQRVYFHMFAISTAIYSSSCEFSLAIERIVSSIRPQNYHTSTFSKILLSLTMFIVIFGACVGFLVHGGKYYMTGGLLMLTLDASTITVNTIGVRYCGRRYEELQEQSKSTLNERYQVKEALDMSFAMQPVHCVNLIVKAVTYLTCIFFFSYSDAYGPQTGYVETLHLTVATIFHTMSIIILIWMHPQMSKRAVRIIRVMFNKQPTVAPVKVNSETETEMYFRMFNKGLY